MNAEDALSAALRPPAPEDLDGLVDVAGGRPQLARLIVGLAIGKKLPAIGTRKRTEYETQSRYLRYAQQPGSRRPLPARSLARARRAIAPRMPAWFIGQLRIRGARSRLAGQVVIGGSRWEIRHREVPAGGPGVFLDPSEVHDFTASWLEGDVDEAIESYLQHFANGYAVPSIELPDTVDYIKLWPEGTVEP